MDLSQGKFIDDTEETILVEDKVIKGYGSDTPAVAKLRYGVSDAPSTYARQMDEVKSFFSDMSDNKTRYITSEEDAILYAFAPEDKKDFIGKTKQEIKQSNIAGNILSAGATTLTSGYYGAEMAGASIPTWIKNVGLGYKYYADLLFKSEEERSTPEYMAQWEERQKVEDAVVDSIKEIRKRSEDVAGKIGDALGVGEESIGSFIGQTTGSVLTSLGICYLTKNPSLTAATFALPTYGNVLGKSVEKGEDLTASTEIALGAGTLTGILERWGLQNLIENITTKTLKAAIAKTMGTESIEEVSQQVVEDLPLIFWAKDEQFVNEDGSIKWLSVIKDLASAGFGGALGGALGAGIGASVTNRQRNNLINNLTKNEKYTRSEAETIVAYLEEGDDAARSKYEQTYVQKIGEQKSYDDFIKGVPEIQQAKQVMDSVKEEMSNPDNLAKVTAETMNEALDPANLPNESLDEYAKMVKDSSEQITQQMTQQAEEERKKYDVRDIVQEKGSDKRTIEATKEAVQAFAESEAEEFGLTPREVVEGKTITLANLSDNSGLSKEEKQQILEQSGLADEGTVVTKENGQEPTQEEIEEAWDMMEAEKEQEDKGYIHNVYMQSVEDEKDFYATHNVDRGGIRDALRLGGFAMPSFAVRRIGHETSNQFGEITLLGNKNLASPSRSVEVYDRDAWSPSIAQALRYDLSPRANKFVKDVLSRYGRERELSTFVYNITDEVKNPLGNTVAKRLYLLDKGFSEDDYVKDEEDYLEWYDKNIFEDAEPYLWTENDANTDMIRRKFTLQNMMKYLRKQERSGGGFIGDYPDANRLLQYFAYKFPSLKEMKSKKISITTRAEQYEGIKKLDEEFFELANEIKKEGQDYDFYDGERVLAYALVTDKGVKEMLEREKMKSDEKTIKKIEAYKEKLKSVPTDYFEAKPRRIVGIEEFSGAILPNTKEYDDIADQLEQRGLSVKRVEKGNMEQHKKALDEIKQDKPGVFFQDEKTQPRAFADVTDASNILVGMLNSADISYLPHEMTHVFTNLHVQNCIKYGKFNSIEGIMKYFGVTNPEELIQNRDIQERLARMSIQYVNEGEAPTAGLRRYFEMFKRFGKKLVSGWKEKGLIEEDALPDEVRKFFDSLLGKKKQAKIDYARIEEQKADVIQAIKRIKAGEAVDVSGLPIREVRKLMKVMQTRIPRMPQNLKNALIQAGGIDKEWAKNFDFEAASGEEKNYQLFKRNGAINDEDSLISFLESEGFISPTQVDDYDDRSEQWDRVMDAMENMDKTYREQDLDKVLERESIEEGIKQAQEIIQAVGAEDAFEVIEDIDKLKGRVVSEKEYLESLERRVQNLDKDYKKLYDVLLKDQAREFAQETKEQVKQAKEEIKDYRNQVIDFIKKQDLELKDKAKLISVVKKANTKATFENVINEVRERAANLYRKEQVRRLSDMIQKEVATKRPSLKEQKYAYEENKLFSDLRDWNKLNKADAGIRYEAMHSDEDFMNNLTREDEIRLLFLEYKAMGADSSPQLLNTLLNYIEIAKQVGMESRNEEEYKKYMDRDEVKNDMIKQLETRKGKPTIYIKFASNLYSSLYTIFGKNIADKYELETVQNKSNIHAANHIDKVIREAMKLYNVNSKGAFLNVIAELGKKAATITTVNNNIDTPLSKVGITRDLSTLEIMDIYNAVKNSKTRDDYYYWYGKDQIDGLLSKLTNNEMLWADMMMQSIDERYAPVNESFVKTYYTDLPKVDNYWPATSEHKEVKTVFDVQGDFNQQSPSFLKERVSGRVLPKPTNAYSKYTKHIKGTYWVTDMADMQVELLNILSSLRVKNAIENKLGKDVYGALKRQVEALSFGGLMQDVDYVTGIIDKAINNVVVAKISLGIPVFTGQLSSVGLYSENMGVGKWALGFSEGLAHPLQTYKFMKENVGEFLENRFGGGYDETIGSLIREAEDGKGKYTLSPKSKYNVVNALSYFVRTGDIGAIIYGGYPRLKQLLETMPKEQAIKQFEMETLRGQQSNVSASKSAFQQRKGMTRVFTSFRNFQYQAVRKIVDSVYGYMNGEVSAAQAGKTIALYALYSPIAYELFRQLGNMLFIGSDALKDIGEKVFDTILMQELSIVPIVNDIINYAIKKYRGQYVKSGMTTVGIDDLFRAVDKAYKNEKNIYDYGEIVSPFIEMMTGAPSQRIISTTKKVFEKYK